jgi:GT2 family glycosyltransferase
VNLVSNFKSIGKASANRCCVVAVPAKNEAERLLACLNALAAQVDTLGNPLTSNTFCVLIFANNCTDETVCIARSFAWNSPFPMRVIEKTLPRALANAGAARRAAMGLADAWLGEIGGERGVVLTTDADSRVAPDWLANNLAAIDAGADAVLGRIVLDEEGELLPQALHDRGRLEAAYEVLLTELTAYLDPVEHNPWPHHSTISGASLAVTREAYHMVGGLPSVPLGEDKAFASMLFREDAKIRFCSEVLVTTSGRLDGRAPGGVADTLRLRIADPNAFCDETLEPFRVAIGRAKWRARVRCLHRTGRLAENVEWMARLGIPAVDARRASRSATFGAAWSVIEARSPMLERRLLKPAELPAQISGARRALDRLRKTPLVPNEDLETKRLITVAADNLGRMGHSIDEELGGFVATERVVSLAGPMDKDDISARKQSGRDPRGKTRDIPHIQIVNDFR